MDLFWFHYLKQQCEKHQSPENHENTCHVLLHLGFHANRAYSTLTVGQDSVEKAGSARQDGGGALPGGAAVSVLGAAAAATAITLRVHGAVREVHEQKHVEQEPHQRRDDDHLRTTKNVNFFEFSVPFFRFRFTLTRPSLSVKLMHHFTSASAAGKFKQLSCLFSSTDVGVFGPRAANQ